MGYNRKRSEGGNHISHSLKEQEDRKDWGQYSLKNGLSPVMHINELGLYWRQKADRHNPFYWDDYRHRDHPPIAKKPYTLDLKHYDWVKEEFDKLFETGVISESYSSWSAPIVVVPKGDGGKRLCVDCRALNKITRAYAWPMPRVEDIFAKLGKAKFYTPLDFRWGYHHIALDKDSIKKTAFVSPLGKYEYLKVPFGLAQGPAYFQNLMNNSWMAWILHLHIWMML